MPAPTFPKSNKLVDDLIKKLVSVDVGILMRQSAFDQLPKNPGGIFLSGIPCAPAPDVMFDDRQDYRIMTRAYFDKIVKLLP